MQQTNIHNRGVLEQVVQKRTSTTVRAKIAMASGDDNEDENEYDYDEFVL